MSFEHVYYSSKKRLILMVLGSAVFVAGSAWLLVIADRFNSPLLVRVVGILGMLFFGICLVSFIKAMCDKKVVIGIDSRGITDNSSGTSVGLIEWGDITGFGRASVASNKFLVIHVSDPQKYLARLNNPFVRNAAESNMKMIGSPITISSQILTCKLEELESAFLKAFEHYGKS